MKQYYAVIDTNVIVSALISSLKNKTSAPAQILGFALNMTIIPIYNEEIINEYKDVLSRKKFGFPKEAVNILINAIITLGIHSDKINADATCNDPKDVVFYEVTLSVSGAYLITGNIKDFPLKPFIVTPAKMLDIILTSNQIKNERG